MSRPPIYEQLPVTWKAQDNGELLKRWLSIWDSAYDVLDVKIEKLLETKSIDHIPDKFLPLIGDLVGHRWNSNKTYQWNRQRISELIVRYSYKGTPLAISDLALEHGSGFCHIVDMASTVAVWSRQGTLEEDNCYFFDSDFFHPGVFLLYLSEAVDYDAFMEDFEHQRPVGTKWHYYIQPDVSREPITVSCQTELIIHMDCTPRSRIAIFNESVMLGGAIRSLLLDDEIPS